MDATVWIGLGIALAAFAYAVGRVLAGYPRPDARHRVLRPREAAFLDATALTMFPPGGALSPSGLDARVPAYVDVYLGSVTPRLRRLMRMLLFLIEHATIALPAPGAGGRRRFSSLSPEQRAAVLQAWERSRFFPRRLAFTSLRAIVTLAYFADPAVLRELRLAPFEIEAPVCEADLWFPPIGQPPGRIALSRRDLSPPSDGVPLALDGPLHPSYREVP